MDDHRPKFELEPLEPRLLLSASGIADEAAAFADSTALTCTVVHEFQADDAVSFAAENVTSYCPESRLSSIFNVKESGVQEQDAEGDSESGNYADEDDSAAIPAPDRP